MDETQIAELQSHLRRLHKRSMRSVPPLEGVSRTASRVLRVVARACGGRSEHPDGMRPGQIAEALGMTTSNVAAALRELEEAGYIARRRAAADARQIAVVLTPHGAEVVAAHRALRVDGLREAVEGALTLEEQGRLAAVIPLIAKVAAYDTHDASDTHDANYAYDTHNAHGTGDADHQPGVQNDVDPDVPTKNSEGTPEH